MAGSSEVWGDLGGAVVLPDSPAPSPLRPDTAAFIRELGELAAAAATTLSPNGLQASSSSASLQGEQEACAVAAEDVASQPARAPAGMRTETSRAIASMFEWDDPIVVSRAPGRMDVMVGLAGPAACASSACAIN